MHARILCAGDKLVRWLLAAVSALALAGGPVPAPAQQTPPPCPGDSVVWVHGHEYVPNGPQGRLSQPGHFACRRDAVRDGYADRFDRKVTGSVVESLYEAVDGTAHSARPGYGRYTYVLLTSPKDAARNEALLSVLMDSTSQAATTPALPGYLTVFEIPETPPYWATPEQRSDFGTAVAHYDYGTAHALLVKACAAVPRPAVCDGDLTGPFLVTYGRAPESPERATPPYLIVDLHRLSVRGFVHVNALIKAPVKLGGIADPRVIGGMQSQLLSASLDVADWLPNLVSSVRNITSFVGTK